jgi:hypothetical protein
VHQFSGNWVKPKLDLAKLTARKIEQRLSAELHAANAVVISAATPEEKRERRAAYDRALRRFADFVTKGIVPEDLETPK